MKASKSLWGSLLLVPFLLTACGEDDSGENGLDEEAESAGERITIFQDKVEISDQLEELAAEYTEETGVEVEVWGTTGSDYFQQLQVRLNSNQGPSIFSIQQYTELERIHSYAYDMSDEDYVQYIAQDMELEYEGNIYGVPYGLEGFGLVYNKDLVDPSEVTDYESFVQTLQRFEDEDINGISLADNSFFMIGHLSNYPFSLQDDNYEFVQQLNNGEISLTDYEEFQELGLFMEAIRDYAPNPMEVSYDRQIGDFATGQTAMIHQGNWAAPMFDDYELDFEIGMMPFPLSGNDKLAVGVASSWVINNDKSDEEIQAANDFLEWMFTSERGHEYIVEEFEFVPALTNIEADNLDPLSQEVLDAANAEQTLPWSHIYYPANSVRNNLLPPTEEFFLDDSITPEEYIENLDEAWDVAAEEDE
ncbi:ABC transporter substrate-binding protein [Alteribacter lacisalsi]|uniref:ABC transporter substrate-binding protein n=1 Tax=Alteribacter lacisalsi TaxID=2045244 RepID=A0A2W0H570_9BACI|nr:extracellular solute-binding protein [Alteribacter lacisalsi]PYZ96287.1 ABC transporter substrate-binding protein [Alteribacter lacisalsi]